MSPLVTDSLALVFFCLGSWFMLVGAIGILRLPDLYNRLHAASKCTTLGLLGLLLAAMFHVGTLDVIIKGSLTLVFTFVAAPVGSHVLAKAALHDRCAMWRGTLECQTPPDADRDDAGREPDEKKDRHAAA